MCEIMALETNDTQSILQHLDIHKKKVPLITKYMGSKREILEFVVGALSNIYKGGKICDLFAGTSVLSGALGSQVPMHSNDIQEYSSIFAHTYLADIHWDDYSPFILRDIISRATERVSIFEKRFEKYVLEYKTTMSIEDFNAYESVQRELIHEKFEGMDYYLFIKNYSGTYWSFQQCLWIDSLRKVADEYKESPIYYVILSSIIFAMSYTSQSTGHYAQYRDAKSENSLKDIITYRKKSVSYYFKRKFSQFQRHLKSNSLNHNITILDYRKCLELQQEGTLVYADPPYAFVHYSRFYHALETLVKYDYPSVNFKGRYRQDRHQSPFCQRKHVNKAFLSMFEKIKTRKLELVLSYSNTGMIPLETITNLAKETLGEGYTISVMELAHMHSTMGRSDDGPKGVKEYLVIASMN